ncbi:MAG: hypothetical protein ACKVP0_06165 [Pirellulaceae bacterium]
MTQGDPSPPHPPPRIHLAWLIVPCLAADGLMVTFLSAVSGPQREVLAAFAFGVLGCVRAQGCLLAAWVAWGDGPFLRRLAVHWIIAPCLYVIWLVGMVLAVGISSEVPQIAATVALGVPLVSLAAQFPLWVVRQLFGWRLVRQQADAAQNRQQRLAIRDLMLATLLVATALALARLAPVFKDTYDAWAFWGIAVTVASVASSISLLPAGVLLLRQRPLSRSLAWSSLYALSLIGLVWVAVALKYQFAPGLLLPRAIYVGLSSLLFTFAATLTLAAAIARDRGYRLTSRTRPKANDQ